MCVSTYILHPVVYEGKGVFNFIFPFEIPVCNKISPVEGVQGIKFLIDKQDCFCKYLLKFSDEIFSNAFIAEGFVYILIYVNLILVM